MTEHTRRELLHGMGGAAVAGAGAVVAHGVVAPSAQAAQPAQAAKAGPAAHASVAAGDGVLDLYVNEGLVPMVDDSLVYMRGFGGVPTRPRDAEPEPADQPQAVPGGRPAAEQPQPTRSTPSSPRRGGRTRSPRTPTCPAST